MNILESIAKGPKRIIPNPNYNPRSKRNTQPQFIEVTDYRPDNDIVTDMALEDYKNQTVISDKIAQKYNRESLNWNNWENLDKQLADNQGTFTKWKNALEQTVVSEIVLGTLLGIADLADMVGHAVGLSDGDYQNPVSKFLEEKQEEFKNFRPVYADPELNISNGGFLDAGWWASNIPSIASSLTLLIPAAGTTKALSMLGKIGKGGKNLSYFTRKAVASATRATRKAEKANMLRELGKSTEEIEQLTKLNSFQRWANAPSTISATNTLLKNGTTAALSRAMENYQEARQTYNDTYTQATEYLDQLQKRNPEKYNKIVEDNKNLLQDEKGNYKVDVNNPSELAKVIAKEAADKTFQIDWTNVVFDVIQLYGLKNAWKGLKNAPAGSTSASVRRANKLQAKMLNKSPEEIAEYLANRKFKEKALDKMQDFFIGSKLAVTGELTEGVEEAINYIAQQEGMHYGNVLLNKELGDRNQSLGGNLFGIFNGYDGRLKQYIQAPELWDSAFWGVLGGVAFQGAGSQFRRLGNYIDKKYSKESRVDKDVNDKENPLSGLDDLPENKRRITEIEARGLDYNEYIRNVKLIKRGINPAKSTADNEVAIESEEEQELLLNQLKDEFITKMAVRAMNNGNLSLLKEFMADDNVRKAMIESGVFGKAENGKSESDIEAESKQYIQNALNTIDKVERRYDEEIIALNAAAAELNARGLNSFKVKDSNNKVNDINNSIPVEYLQIAACNNIYNRASIDYYTAERNSTRERIAVLESSLTEDGKLDNIIPYRDNIRLAAYVHELGILRAQRKEYSNQKDKSLSTKLALDNIDKRIAYIENQLNDEQLVYATAQSLLYELDGDENVREKVDKSDYIKYLDSIIIGSKESDVTKVLDIEGLNDLSERSRTTLNEATLGAYDKLLETTEKTYDLNETSPELAQLYAKEVALDYQIAKTNNALIRTVNEVRDHVGYMHNSMNEARREAINTSKKTLYELYREHGSIIDDAIRAMYNSDEAEVNDLLKDLSSEDVTKFKTAVEVLDLTKDENKAIYFLMANEFRAIDAGENTREENNNENTEEETSENYSGQNSADTASQNNESIVSPQSGINAATEPQNGQIEQNEPVTDRQDISNRTPICYTKFSIKDGVLQSGRRFTTDKGHVAVYDNNDGTYTLDIRNDKTLLQNPEVFENGENITLLNGAVIEKKPIAIRNHKGNFVISERGYVSESETGEDADTSAEVSAQETAENEAASAQANPQSSLPSTGESTILGPEESTNTRTDVPVNDTDETEVMASPKMKILGAFQEEIAKDNSPIKAAIKAKQYDVAREKLENFAKNQITKYKNEGVDNAEELVEYAKQYWLRKINNKENGTKTMKSSIVDLITTPSSVQNNSFSTDYVQALDNMVKEYVKEVGVLTINDKPYINVEDLLRYVNDVMNDREISLIMIDSLRAYLNTEESRKKYVITDREELNSSNFEKNVLKTESERLAEKIRDNSIRVDIYHFVTSPNIAKSFKALDELQNGDNLDVKRIDKFYQLLDSKGRVVGELPIPKVNSKTGAFEVTNRGWITDIDNKYNSKLKQTFISWFTTDNDVRKIVAQLAYDDSLSANDKKQLISDLLTTSEIQQARIQGFIDGKAKPEELIELLVDVMRYSKSNYTLKRTSLIDGTKLINSYFAQLYNSYSTISALNTNPNIKITVDKISDGEVIRLEKEDDKPYVQDGIAKLSPSTNHIAISDTQQKGLLRIAGASNDIQYRFTGGSTFITIPNRNGSTEYVHAIPVDVTDKHIGTDAKEIFEAIQQEANKLLLNYATDSSADNFNNLKDFLENIIYYRRQTMFNGVKYKLNNRDGIQEIILSANGITITIYDGLKDGKGVKQKATSIRVIDPGITTKKKKNDNGEIIEDHSKRFELGSTEAQKYLKMILNNLRYRFDFSYVASDNVQDQPMQGIATRVNGKFVIKVGDKTWTYDSFNEFMINNNLFKVNTKVENGSNFRRRGIRSQRGNQVLFIKAEVTSPVEKNKVAEIIETQEETNRGKILSINEQVYNIVTGNTQQEHDGNAILDLTLADEMTKEELNNAKALNLLPKSIIFDENFNRKKEYEKFNAEVNPKTGVVTVGTKWIEMFNNPATRKQAIRKLIHEELHYKLHKNKGYVRSAKKIYEEFKEALASKEVDSFITELAKQNNIAKQKLVEHFNSYLFKEYDEDDALEEFLVESITSEDLATLLNNISAKDYQVSKRRNLLQKIFELLSKVFKWGITEGSLYEKELYTLRKAFKESDNNNIENNEEETKQKTKEPETKEPEIKEPETKEVEVKKPEVKESTKYGTGNNSKKLRGKFSSVSEIEGTKINANTNTIKPEHLAEMQQIKEQAIANGTFMKAPNGNSTNLTERQWLQVRTKAFKDWFGDWKKVISSVTLNEKSHAGTGRTHYYEYNINDNDGYLAIAVDTKNKTINITGIEAVKGKGLGINSYIALQNKFPEYTINSDEEALSKDAERMWDRMVNKGIAIKNSDKNYTLKLPNVSKVVDENGEPLVVYHYTDNVFDTFNLSYFGKNDMGDHGRGFYFTPQITKEDKNYFKEFYGNNIIPVFLNIKNPVDAKKENNTKLFNREKRPYLSHKEKLQYDIDVQTFVKNDIENKLYGNDEENKKYKDPDYIGTQIETKRLEQIKDKINKLQQELNNLSEDYDENAEYNSVIEQLNSYDGVINGDFEIVVPNPNQIKSATDNNGDFSDENDNIKHSSRDELILTVSSPSTLRDKLTLEQQIDFDKALKQAEIKVACKL